MLWHFKSFIFLFHDWLFESHFFIVLFLFALTIYTFFEIQSINLLHNHKKNRENRKSFVKNIIYYHIHDNRWENCINLCINFVFEKFFNFIYWWFNKCSLQLNIVLKIINDAHQYSSSSRFNNLRSSMINDERNYIDIIK